MTAENQTAIKALLVHRMSAVSLYSKFPWWYDPKTEYLMQTDFFILFEQIVIDFPAVDDFFRFTEIYSTWLSTSKHPVLMYQISYCKVIFDLSLKNLTKN